MSDREQYIDCGNVFEAYALTLARIERLGPCTRMTFACPSNDGGQHYNMAVLKVIVPTSALPTIAAQMTAPIGGIDPTPREEHQRAH